VIIDRTFFIWEMADEAERYALLADWTLLGAIKTNWWPMWAVAVSPRAPIRTGSTQAVRIPQQRREVHARFG
jgi:hypothetical protein